MEKKTAQNKDIETENKRKMKGRKVFKESDELSKHE